MQIVINISKEDKDIMECDDDFIDTKFEIIERLLDSVHNGIVLPDNPTNGEVIKALFPGIEVCDNPINEKVYTGIPYNELIGVNIDATHEWWDAPYERGDINADSN